MSRTIRNSPYNICFHGNKIKDKDRKNMRPSRACLNNSHCSYCRWGRTFKNRKVNIDNLNDLKEYYKDND